MDMSQYDTNGYDMSKVNSDWTYDNLSEARKAYVDQIITHAESLNIDVTDITFSRQQLRLVSLQFKNNDDVPNWIVKDHDRRANLGVYFIPEVADMAVDMVGDGEVPDDNELTQMAADEEMHNVVDEFEADDEMVMSVIDGAEEDDSTLYNTEVF